MFQPQMYMHVSQEGTVRFPTDGRFCVCAWKNDTEEFLSISEASGKEVTITQTHDQEEVTDTLWVVSDGQMWPSVKEELTFLAYSPESLECTCDLLDGISLTTDILRDQTDILFTHPHADRHKVRNGWIVPLQFSHALCKVSFRVKNRVSDDEEITIKRISLEKACHKGSFSSLKSPQWECDGAMEEIMFFEGSCPTGNLPEEIGQGLLMIPQKLGTRINISYDYTTAQGSTIPMNLQTTAVNTSLEAGHSYAYTLSVGIDEVKLMQEIIGKGF